MPILHTTVFKYGVGFSSVAPPSFHICFRTSASGKSSDKSYNNLPAWGSGIHSASNAHTRDLMVLNIKSTFNKHNFFCLFYWPAAVGGNYIVSRVVSPSLFFSGMPDVDKFLECLLLIQAVRFCIFPVNMPEQTFEFLYFIFADIIPNLESREMRIHGNKGSRENQS